MNGEEIFRKIFDRRFEEAKRSVSAPPTKSCPLKKWKFIVANSFHDVMHGVGICLVEQKILTQSECNELFVEVYRAHMFLLMM